MQALTQWLSDMEWSRMLPEILGKAVGVLLGVAISWWVLFRKRLKTLDRLRRGDSDELLFQMHYLLPTDDGRVQLLFRNIAPRRTIDDAYDNPAARETLRQLARQTTLNAPIVPTQGRIGFEILNDATSILSGWLATSSMARRPYLFCMTCEDRQVVRKECVRCFLFREEDLMRFADWAWCRDQVRVEKPWHWLRVVTLHRIASYHKDECTALPVRDDSVPFVDDQRRHRRIVTLSLGLCEEEVATGPPCRVDWADKLPDLKDRKVELRELSG